MVNNIGKVKTYIGFAVKSRKIKFGVDDILKLKKADLILVSDNLAESGLKKLKTFALNKSIKLYTLPGSLFNEFIDNTSIKAMAILDYNLADAIKKNLANF